MTRLSIIHKTAYKYNKRVTLSYNEARMTPLTDPQQVVLESSLKVSPSQASLSSYRDYWGTRVTAFDMQMPHEHLEVLSTTTVEVHRVERIPAEADIVGWDVLESPETLNKFSDWIPQSQLTGPGTEVLEIIPGVVEGPQPARGRHGGLRMDARRNDLHEGLHRRHHKRRAGLEPAPGRLPGPGAPGHRRAAQPRHPGPVRVRLPAPALDGGPRRDGRRDSRTPGWSGGTANGAAGTPPTTSRPATST